MAPDADATAGTPKGWHDLEAVLAEEPVATLLAAYLASGTRGNLPVRASRGERRDPNPYPRDAPCRPGRGGRRPDRAATCPVPGHEADALSAADRPRRPRSAWLACLRHPRPWADGVRHALRHGQRLPRHAADGRRPCGRE